MPYCNKCGEQLKSTDQTCTKCVRTVNEINHPSNKWIWITATILTAIIGFTAITYLLTTKKTTARENPVYTDNGSNDINRKPIQNTFQNRSSYPEPTEVKYIFSEKDENGFSYLNDRFFPIGWSGDGKFAYALEPADEACGCYFFSIYVQDMATDKIIWKWEFNNSDDPEKQIDLSKIWKQKSNFFTNKLNEFKIEPVSYNKISSFPITTDDADMSCAISNSFNENPLGFLNIKETKIYLKANNKTQKKIYHKNFRPEKEGFSYQLSNTVFGYLKNPFENRIAIVYSPLYRGYEGPPNVYRIEPIGCRIE
jgi:hypothetical protein